MDNLRVYYSNTRSNFLERELGLTWKALVSLGSNPKGITSHNSILQMGNSESELSNLHFFKDGGALVHLYADETYNLKLNFQILKNKKVKIINF